MTCDHDDAELIGGLPDGRPCYLCPQCQQGRIGDGEWFEPPVTPPNPLFSGEIGRYNGLTIKQP